VAALVTARRWGRLRPHVALWIFLALALVQLPVLLTALANWGYTPWVRPGYSDFGQYYLWARIGLHAGWNHLYDLAVQRHEWLALGGSNTIVWYPNVDTPPQAWLVAPLALLPLPLGYAIWMLLIASAFLLTWRLVAPGRGLARWASLAVALAASPIVVGFLLGQAVVLVVAGVAASWWFLRHRQDELAGLVLVVIVLKPHLGWLVPLALLAAGNRRAFAGWAAASTVVAAGVVISLGGDGLAAYAARLSKAAHGGSDFLSTGLTLPGVLGERPLVIAVQGLVILLTLWIAFRHRGQMPDIAITAGLLGSLLITPYLHPPDLMVLFVAAAIFLHARPSPWQTLLLASMYFLIFQFVWFIFLGDASLAHSVISALLIAVEFTWFASICWMKPGQRPQTSRRPLEGAA
jgi:hypothetical protein